MRLIEQFDTGRGTYRSALYRPYQAGTFGKGIQGRIKAGLATAAIIKLLSNAGKNAAADPTLCRFVPSITVTQMARAVSLNLRPEATPALGRGGKWAPICR